MTLCPANVYRARGRLEQRDHAKIGAILSARRTFASYRLSERRDRKILSGGGVGSRRAGRLVIERGRNVADADDPDQAVVVDHRQMADVVLVHEMTDLL